MIAVTASPVLPRQQSPEERELPSAGEVHAGGEQGRHEKSPAPGGKLRLRSGQRAGLANEQRCGLGLPVLHQGGETVPGCARELAGSFVAGRLDQ